MNISYRDMMLPTIMEARNDYTTKDGEEITFKYREDIEGENRGFQVNMLEAFVGGKNVGYLKIGYIPRKKFNKFYPNIFYYLGHIKGECGVIEAYESNDSRELLEKLIRIVENWNRAADKIRELESLDKRELESLIKHYMKEVKKKHGKQFDEFEKWHVDHPLVDFIKVEPEYRRKGIGLALYTKGAKLMAKKGMELWASTLQSDKAQAAWDKIGQVLPVRTEPFDWYGQKKERRCISYL